MIVINGKPYKLCLLDTNAVSEMVKNPAREFRNFIEKFIPEKHVPCFSVFSILELRRSPAVFSGFLDYFSAFPCLILKSHEQLIRDELTFYPAGSTADPVLLSPLSIAYPPGLSRRTGLEMLVNSQAIAADGEKWLDGRDGVLDGMLGPVHNFPPEGSRYTESQVRSFVQLVVFEQVAIRNRQFAEQQLAKGCAVNTDAFPSLKMIAYTVLHKFYQDRNRQPSRSDVFDVIVSALLPYVDGVVTERHQAEVIRRVKRLGSFISSLQVWTLRDLRDMGDFARGPR